MASGQRVLLVDGLSETEEVLKAVLEPRGLHVDHVSGPPHDGTASDSLPPHVLVIHDDGDSADGSDRNGWRRIPQVIIGSAEVAPMSDDRHRYLREPFQYRELIQAIEQLLATATG